MIKASTALVFAALIALAAPASAQTTAPPSATGGKPAASATTGSPAATRKSSTSRQRTAKSLDCSKQADAKNIHGKERRRFMNSCKKS